MPATPSRRSRRAVLAASVVLGLATNGVLLAAPSQADDSDTLTVVGTADVYDSHLVQSVIAPGFEKAYPQYTLNYVSKGSGAAIQYAEAGTASAMLVHAASLENQFVGSGYSLEKYGRAVFYGDFVLLGPSSDPAHVLRDHPHDIVGAFEEIAAAGAGGTADLVSRGDTSGTAVAEHKLWKLTSGVQTCTVSDANGGGTTPSNASGACPDDVDYPSWYHATGLSQSGNVTNADTCNYGNGHSCYVLTDRGTYNYLQSQDALSDLKVVTRDNAESAIGHSTALVNSFHAYAVNPAKFSGDSDVKLNTPAAKAFLTWLTSSTGQAAVGNYLKNSTGGAPFLPDAAPALTLTSALASQVPAGSKITVTGYIKNRVPGTPRLSGETVRLRGATTSGKVSNLAKATTGNTGRFTLSYKPTANRSYAVYVPGITKVEDASLSPVFGDLLAAGTTSVGAVGVVGKPSLSKITGGKGVATFAGKVAPTASGSNAHLSLYGAPTAKAGGGLKYLGQRSLTNGQTSFTKTFQLKKGKWTLQLRYLNVGQIVGGSAAAHKVTVR